MATILGYANKLEGVLRNYLDCGYHEFRVKANGWLDETDWKSGVYFALGCKYEESGRDEAVKEKIGYFLENTFMGESIKDIIHNHEYYSFDSEDKAFEYVSKTIKELEELLNR